MIIMREEIKNWWEQALSDLHTSEVNLKEEIYYASAFFSQQAAEKALKAYVLFKEKESAQSHSLVFLAKKLNAPKNIFGAAARLNPQYIITRYPDAAGGIPMQMYTKEMAEELLNASKEIIEWTRKSLQL